MAYTIISQNNSTTTLSDGVNTITVPSRVNLTSGNFTIVEVNNNMATLEDGDGNVYRDIPCVATLAGEGGGGGSGLPDQTGHSGEFLTTDGTDASWAAVDALPSQTGQSGKFLTTDGTDASWAAVNALPSQTGQSGKFLTTDGTDASWSDKPLVNTATGTASLTIQGTPCSSFAGINIGDNSFCGGIGVAIGRYSEVRSSSNGAVAIGSGAASRANYGVVVGNGLVSANNAIQLGCRSSQPTNSDANTFKVANAYGNYEIMSADGTIPTARLTKVNTTVTLATADWSSNTQTVTVTGMTATGVVMVSPDPTDQSAYTSAGIICSAQAAGTLTFTCSTTPTADLSVNVVML